MLGMVRAGKSTLAQQLASRLNLPNVLQTDIIYEVRARSARCGCARSWPVAVNAQSDVIVSSMYLFHCNT